MNQSQFLQGLAGLVVFAGVGLIWRAIQNPLCAGFGGGCAPDIAYLVPGTVALSLGVALFLFTHQQRLSDFSII